MRRLTKSLATKLTACLVGSMVLLFGALGYLNLRFHRQQLEERVVLSADGISDLIRRSLRYSMLRDQRDEVFQIINTIGRQPSITKIRIFNKEGRITFSTYQEEVGKYVDKKAEACYACHARAQPLTRLDRPDRMRIYVAKDGERVLGLISPIYNEPDCSNASCHAHSAPGSRVLGVLDTDLSLGPIDQSLAARQEKLAVITGGAILVVSLISIALVWIMVRRPVRVLTEGTERVAQGELDYKIPVTSSDELGSLAASFNNMTTELKKAREENLEWTRTLENRVDEKSGELERAYKHLAQAEKMVSLGKLAAVVAHEINNPLAGILTYTKLISRMAEKEFDGSQRMSEAKDILHIIEGESRRCGNIVKNLLTFARQAPLSPQKNDLNAIVDRCLLLLNHQLELQTIDLVKDLATGMPAIYCDANQVQQALLALLMNAIDVMPSGGRLRVTTFFDSRQRLGRVAITDEGPGISEEVLPHLFEPFFTTKEEGKGVGLGLAIAYGIVQQHGGNIDVVSTPQKGTTFTVLLPEEAHGIPAEKATITTGKVV
ncbi:MAG: HAMP domain-containing protein [Acidobacteria bacterium]|nr:HAMP domain-containing protein [Acidobacteriota bacterium]